MNSLNPRQQEAAYATGSVTITAGAGTGKTHVLAERYHNLLTANGWSPLNVVAVTFTDKAADELRSRIRETAVAKGGDPRIVAEIDAAQISTIHALAARICRDFYEIAGIPADFRLIDENESTLWTLSKLEEAIGEVCVSEAFAVGYSFLLDALTQLLADPYRAEMALAKCDVDQWRQILDRSKESAREEFVCYLETSRSVRRIREIQGADTDKMELQRRSVLATVDSVLQGDFSAIERLNQIGLSVGSKNKWNDGEFVEVKELLTELREKSREVSGKLDLELGESDEEMLAEVNVIGSAFEKAREYLTKAKFADKYLDYNDLEIYALKIVRNSEAASHYRERWKAFLVDEFQDTNPIQAELLSHLTSEAGLTIVGDEKQSIYGFRGADVEVFKEFKKRVESCGGQLVDLEETYRANSTLVGRMNRIFEPLLGYLHQGLVSSRNYGGPEQLDSIKFDFVESDEKSKSRKQNVEARHIARTVSKMVEDEVPVFDKAKKKYRPVNYGDFAVLSRVWEPLEIYGDAFAAEGIPAVNAGGGSLVKTREFKDAAAILTFLADHLDDLSLVAVLRSPFFAVSDLALYKFALTVGPKTFWWPRLRETEDLEPNLAVARDCLTRLIKERIHHSPEGLLQLAARETGYAAVIANLPHGQRREADWRGTLQFVRGLQEKGWEDLFSVMRYLRLAIRSELDIERPTVESGNAVAMMTIHAAKGLEWPVVFVPDLTRQFQSDSDVLKVDTKIGIAYSWDDINCEKVEPAIYKLIKQRCKEREDAERRRVLYVAITRAADFVYLSSTGSKGASLDLLQPGLDSAGIQADPILVKPEDMLPPSPGEPPPFEDLPCDTHPVNVATESVTATGISIYAACPQKYKFQFVDGHPGLGEGAATASSVGTLAHLVLELGIESAAALEVHSGCSDGELIEKALEQAQNFREHSAFANVRELPAQREVRFSTEMGGIRVYGIADLVGEDFVLDYKTDTLPEPEKHGLQLWAYARALGKSKAYIAYLRHNQLHEITSDDLSRLDRVGFDLIAGLRSGDFAPNASPSVCGRCTYNSICTSSHDPGDKGSLV